MLKWESFSILNENLQAARSTLRRAGIPEDNKDFVKLREILQRNPGYLGKFTHWLVVDKIPIQRLANLFDHIKATGLSKPIDQFNRPEEIIDQIVKDKYETYLNQIYKAIPSGAREDMFDKDGDNYDPDSKRKFERFVKQNLNKKDKIVDFLSKKGGRYDYADELITALEEFVDFPSIAQISNNVKNGEKGTQFIYEDEEILAIAVNYDGIKKYGSSYWCIHEDEGTFNDYMRDDWDGDDVLKNRVQLVVYLKNKNPFDDRSMVGITVKIANKLIVSAAHWEDDGECSREGSRIVNKISKSETIGQDIFKALKMIHEDDIDVLDALQSPFLSSSVFAGIADGKSFNKMISDIVSEVSQRFDYDEDYAPPKSFWISLLKKGNDLGVKSIKMNSTMILAMLSSQIDKKLLDDIIITTDKDSLDMLSDYTHVFSHIDFDIYMKYIDALKRNKLADIGELVKYVVTDGADHEILYLTKKGYMNIKNYYRQIIDTIPDGFKITNLDMGQGSTNRKKQSSMDLDDVYVQALRYAITNNYGAIWGAGNAAFNASLILMDKNEYVKNSRHISAGIKQFDVSGEAIEKVMANGDVDLKMALVKSLVKVPASLSKYIDMDIKLKA